MSLRHIDDLVLINHPSHGHASKGPGVLCPMEGTGGVRRKVSSSNTRADDLPFLVRRAV